MAEDTKIRKLKSYPAVAATTSGAAKDAFPGSHGNHRKGIHIANNDGTNAVAVYITDGYDDAQPTVGTTRWDYRIPALTTLDMECSAQSRVYLGSIGGDITVDPKEIY